MSGESEEVVLVFLWETADEDEDEDEDNEARWARYKGEASRVRNSRSSSRVVGGPVGGLGGNGFGGSLMAGRAMAGELLLATGRGGGLLLVVVVVTAAGEVAAGSGASRCDCCCISCFVGSSDMEVSFLLSLWSWSWSWSWFATGGASSNALVEMMSFEEVGG